MLTDASYALQFEQAVIPEAQKAKQLAKKNVDLDEANAKLSAQVQVSNEKAKRCMDSVHKWQGQFDDERGAHGYLYDLLACDFLYYIHASITGALGHRYNPCSMLLCLLIATWLYVQLCGSGSPGSC